MQRAVSVIIPVRNGERTLARAIDSVLAQTYTDGVEIIVVNNGSTDSTAEVIRSYGDKVVTIYEPKPGVSVARNAGIAAARGEYIALLDSDDFWLPQKLERVVPMLDSDPECVLAYHDAMEIDLSGNVIRASYSGIGRGSVPSLRDFMSGKWRGLRILTCNTLMRRSAVCRVGGFDEELTACEDTALWIALREQGRFRSVPEALACREWEPSERREEWYIAGGYALRDRLRPRYGDHVAALAASWTLNLAGTMAMLRGDRALARKRYLASLRLRPDRLRTWLRLCTTLLPVRLIVRLERVGRARFSESSDRPIKAATCARN